MHMEYKSDVTVKVNALAAYVASVIAMAGTTVRMSPLSLVMIHNPITVAIGGFQGDAEGGGGDAERSKRKHHERLRDQDRDGP